MMLILLQEEEITQFSFDFGQQIINLFILFLFPSDTRKFEVAGLMPSLWPIKISGRSFWDLSFFGAFVCITSWLFGTRCEVSIPLTARPRRSAEHDLYECL